MIPRSVKILILVHIIISLVGMAAHLDQHPPGQSLFFWWPVLGGVVSLVVVPLLYARPATVAWGFLFNAMFVVIGTLGMAYFLLITFEGSLTFYRLITESTLPKIFLLWTRLLVAWFILTEMEALKISTADGGCLE
ncbi:MAG: hypothetical protein ACLFV2_00350 [Desulfurivibrionaceae bacterium]